MSKKVSIIIPVFQAENTIENCLNSVVNQNYKNIDVWVIIDGSTDDSEKICNKFETEYDFIHVVIQKNSGAASARNRGLQLATGDYVYFLDSDDEIMLNCIERLVQNMVICDLLIFEFQSQNTKLDVKKGNLKPEFWDKQQTLERMFNVNNRKRKPCSGYLWNKLFKLNIIKNNHIKFDQAAIMWEDMLFCCSYLVFANNILYLPEILYKYNNNSFSISHSLNGAGYRNWIKTAEKVSHVIKSNFNFFFQDFMGVFANLAMEYIIFCKHNHQTVDQSLLVIVNKYRKKLRKKFYFRFLFYKFFALLH